MTFTAYKPTQQANDLAVNWNGINPTPKVGQLCVESDTLQFKIGDGVRAYNALPYAGGSSSGAIDGGAPDSTYGGTSGVDGGTP